MITASALFMLLRTVPIIGGIMKLNKCWLIAIAIGISVFVAFMFVLIKLIESTSGLTDA